MLRQQETQQVRPQRSVPCQASYMQLKLENAAMRAELTRLRVSEQEHAEQLARLFARKDRMS